MHPRASHATQPEGRRCAHTAAADLRPVGRALANTDGTAGNGERMAFEFVARLRDEQVAPDGNLRDTLIYALLAREYAGQTTG